MGSLLSPGVAIKEEDRSLVVSTAGTSIAAFGGVFSQGEAKKAIYLSSIQELESIFGTPTNANYNDWFQAYCFLRRSGSLYVSRALDSRGTENRKDTTYTLAAQANQNDEEVTLNDVSNLYENQMIQFGEDKTKTIYTITKVTSGGNKIGITPAIQTGETYNVSDKVYTCYPTINAYGECLKTGSVYSVDEKKLKSTMKVIANPSDWEFVEQTLAFSNPAESKLKFVSKNPGMWGNDIQVGIGVKSDFDNNSQILTGVVINDQFEYTPSNTEVGVIVIYKGTIVETFLVSMIEGTKDYNNKSMYIEDVINRQSSYIYCKVNNAISDMPKSSLDSNLIDLKYGEDGVPSKGDIVSAYTDVYSSKEEIDIDIVISNEIANKDIADFCKLRGDVIGYAGASYSNVVNVGNTKAVENLLTARSAGEFNFDNKYFTIIGNYGYIYDSYNDKNRWINLAGASAGIRASTTNATQPWYAAAGLNQGTYTDIIKLAFNPNQGNRDQLYKNNINPVVSFPGQGIVLWGQKTATSKPSSFDRVNVRMLFNYAERKIANSARYIIFEQNDDTTRNSFVSMVTPLLDGIKANRGIEDYRVICDTSNNTPQVIANNEFVANIMLKPLYSAEFVYLTFTSVGATVSFEEA